MDGGGGGARVFVSPVIAPATMVPTSREPWNGEWNSKPRHPTGAVGQGPREGRGFPSLRVASRRTALQAYRFTTGRLGSIEGLTLWAATGRRHLA